MYKFSTNSFVILFFTSPLILCIRVEDMQNNIRKTGEHRQLFLVRVSSILSKIEQECKSNPRRQQMGGLQIQKQIQYRWLTYLTILFHPETQIQNLQISRIQAEKQIIDWALLCQILTNHLNTNNHHQLNQHDSYANLPFPEQKSLKPTFHLSIMNPYHQRQLQAINTSNLYCGYKCYECDERQLCRYCRPGYALNQLSQCQIQASFHFLQAYLSFGFFLPFHCILMHFVNQFAYYEYQYFSDGDLNNFLMYLGNVNREKKVPAFFRQFFYHITKKIEQLKIQLTSKKQNNGNEQNQSSVFLNKEQISVHFLANTIQVYFFGIPILILTSIFLKLLNFAVNKFFPNATFKFTYTSFPELIYISEFLYGQYLSFMFWKQIILIYLIDFTDKLNIVFAVIIMFILLIQAVAGYTIVLTFWPSKYSLLFDQIKKHGDSRAFICGIFMNPGYYVIIGTLQSLYILDLIKMNLFIILKLGLLLMRVRYVKERRKVFINLKIFQSLNLVFCIFRCIGLYVIKAVRIAEGVQLIILYSICALMVLEVFHLFIRYAFILLAFIKGKIEAKKGKIIDINSLQYANYTISVKVPKKYKRESIPVHSAKQEN